MNFLKKLFKNKRGSQLVEKIMLWGFAVAAGGAVILYTSNVIIEAKNHNITGLNGSGDSNRNGVIPESQGTEGLIYSSTGSGFKVTGYEGTSDTVVVPSTHEGLPVTQIASESFAWQNTRRETVTSITVGSGVTKIGNQVFHNCTSLASLSLPDSITSFGTGCFYRCVSLANFTIPSGLTQCPDFYECTSLTSITIPSTITRLGNSTFWGCGLTSITIPNSVTYMGDSVFAYCSSLSSVTLSNSVTQYKGSTFSYCDSLTNITIPSGATSLAKYFCSNCPSLQTVYIPNTVTSVADSAFWKCNPNLTINCQAPSKPGGWNEYWWRPGFDGAYTINWGA